MVVIENMPPSQPRPALVAPANVGAGAGEGRAALQALRGSTAAAAEGVGREYEVVVPDRIPTHCVEDTGSTYEINPLLMLAVSR